MKSLLIIASFIALAVASPVHRSIVAGPAILETEPIAVGPAIVPHPIAVGPVVIEAEPVAVGPAIIETEPISVGPAIIETPVAVSPVQVVEEAVNVPTGTSLVQIILNINGVSHVIDAPISVGPVAEAIVPEPVHIVEVAPEPVQVIEVAPEPVQIIEVAPEPVQVIEVAPESVAIGVPQLPNPAVVLPESLN